MNYLKITKEFLGNFNPTFYITKGQRTKEGIDALVVTFADEDSYIAEQYKVLRTNLYTLSATTETPIKTIMITSSIPREGKGITASNLAFAISLDKTKKVLLIDADFRKPTIHELFGLPRMPGFSDLLSAKTNIEFFLKKPTLGNLYVIPSGNVMPNPAEALNVIKIKEIIEKVKSSFNYIIFDTPPVINVTDALIIGPLCDAVILVVKAEVTPKSLIEETFDLLKNAQAKPKACILTNTHIPQYHYYRHIYTEKNEAS